MLRHFFLFLLFFPAACFAEKWGNEGQFRYAEEYELNSLYPPSVITSPDARVVTQVYEGLVSFDPRDLSLRSCLAEKWEVNGQNTEFTFYLRKGVRFHDDPCFPGGKGRELSSNDLQYCFNRLCEFELNNQAWGFLKGLIAGGDEYYNSTVKGHPLRDGVAGIKALDQYTLRITLVRPCADFLQRFGLPMFSIYPKEAVEKYGEDMRVKCVGTGPFFIKLISDSMVIMERNAGYWGRDAAGHQLPYLDAVRVYLSKSSWQQERMLREGAIDMMFVYQPQSGLLNDSMELKNDLAGFRLYQAVSNSVNYFSFRNSKGIFSSQLVRQAFNYAIDRKKIASLLHGMGVPAYTVLPPIFPGIDPGSIQLPVFDPAKARELLALAGYPKGKGFPEVVLTVNSSGSSSTTVPELVQNMLRENLGITVKIEAVPFAQLIDQSENGDLDFWKSGWVADYPSPLSFLNCFYGKSIPSTPGERSGINSSGYYNSFFDELIDKINRSPEQEERDRLCLRACQLLADDAAVLPLFTWKNLLVLGEDWEGIYSNSMRYLNFCRVRVSSK